MPAKLALIPKYDGLDVYREHILNDRTLSPNQERVWSIMRKAQTRFLTGATRIAIAKQIQSDYDVSEQAAYAHIRKAIALFGDFQKADKEGYRAIYTEHLRDVIKRAQEAEDIPSEIKAIELIAKLNHLTELNETTPLDPAQFLTAPVIIFTTHPSALPPDSALNIPHTENPDEDEPEPEDEPDHEPDHQPHHRIEHHSDE